MAYELRDNSGSLFKNDKKGVEKAPDYRGDVMVNGVKMEIAAWIKPKADGSKFMSLTFKEPFKKKDAPKPDDDDGF